MLKQKNKSNEVLIAEIHETFNTAGDKLLASALEIINQHNVVEMEKAQRLKKIGFLKAKEVNKWEEIRMTKELSDLIKYYQIKYPNSKFITKEQVESICKKYNLCCAPIDRYKGFVPEIKLKEIESFHIAEKDKGYKDIRVTGAWNTGIGIDFMLHFIGGSNVHRKLNMKTIPANDERVSWHRKKLFCVYDDSGEQMYVTSYMAFGFDTMVICAPQKDMDVAGLKKVGSFFLSQMVVNVPDPVVLQPCKGGYLIVAAWGDEASDEIVVNHTHN